MIQLRSQQPRPAQGARKRQQRRKVLPLAGEPATPVDLRRVPRGGAIELGQMRQGRRAQRLVVKKGREALRGFIVLSLLSKSDREGEDRAAIAERSAAISPSRSPRIRLSSARRRNRAASPSVACGAEDPGAGSGSDGLTRGRVAQSITNSRAIGGTRERDMTSRLSARAGGGAVKDW